LRFPFLWLEDRSVNSTVGIDTFRVLRRIQGWNVARSITDSSIFLRVVG